MAQRAKSIFRFSVLAAGVVLAALGMLRGELNEILRKAVVVCLECIGIG